MEDEVHEIARSVSGTLSIRTKSGPALLDKVSRMSVGTSGRGGRARYQVGDVIDAVGARITVADTERLAQTMSAVDSRFGTDGRVLEMENLYAEPKAHNPAYRVVPYVIATELNGQPYTYELQVCTRRASVASDLEHNSVY